MGQGMGCACGRLKCMKAFIQKHQGEFANVNVFTAMLGFREKGYLIEYFEYPDLETLSLDEDCIVIGGIPVVVRAMERMGIRVPVLTSIPPSIAVYARRRVWETVLGEARRHVLDGLPIFMKPRATDRKLFGGHVLRSFRDSIQTASLPDDHPVICSEPITFVSEYRVFVIEREIVGIKFYKGDFCVFPDAKMIDLVVAAYENAPSGYGIDFGVTDQGDTVLVEVNEGYSLGSYGLTPLLYSHLIETRWQELLSTRDCTG